MQLTNLRSKAPLIAAGMALSLAACASPEARVARGLTDLGLPSGLSECMADRMVDNLSSSQLSRVADFAEGLDKDVSRMTVGEIAFRFGGLGDPETVQVMARAAAGCAIAG